MLGVGAGPEGGMGGDSDSAGAAWSPAPRRGAPMSQNDRDAIAVLLSVHGLGPLTLGRLVTSLGSAAAILDTADRPGAATVLVEASCSPDGEARPMPLVVAQGLITASADRARILAE